MKEWTGLSTATPLARGSEHRPCGHPGRPRGSGFSGLRERVSGSLAPSCRRRRAVSAREARQASANRSRAARCSPRSPPPTPPSTPGPRSLSGDAQPALPQSPGDPRAATPQKISRSRGGRCKGRKKVARPPPHRTPQRDAGAGARRPRPAPGPRLGPTGLRSQLHAGTVLGPRAHRGQSEALTARRARQRVSQRRRPCSSMKQGVNAGRGAVSGGRGGGYGHSDIPLEASLQPVSREREGTGGIAGHLMLTPPKATRPSL